MNFSQSDQKVVEGYLQKQKRRIKNGQITSWRFFRFSLVDKDRCFIIKLKQEDMSALKTYNAKQVKGFTDKLTKEENIFGINSSFSFKIITTMKPYLLCASNKEEFQSWMKVLQKFSDSNPNQNQGNYSNFASKYKIPSNSQNLNKNQIEVQGLQFTPQNMNPSTSGNSSLQNNSSKSNNSNNNDGSPLNNSKKKEANYGRKSFNKNWGEDDVDSDEEKDTMQPIGNYKNNLGSMGHPGNFGSMGNMANIANFGSIGNFGTFGNNNSGLMSNSKLNNNLNNQENSAGYVKYEDKVKFYDSRLRKLSEIPFESNEKSNSPNNSNSYGKPPIQNKKEQTERVQMILDPMMFKNTNNSVNSSLANNSIRNDERMIKPKEVGLITNNSQQTNVNFNMNNNIINNNNNKYQPNFGKLEITGEMKKLKLNHNIVFEGINPKKEEKGLIQNSAPKENIKPLIGNVTNQNITNQNLIFQEQMNTKESALSNKKNKKNFIVEFSNQDCFEISPFGAVPIKEEKKTEFDSIRNKQNQSHGNVLNLENKLKFPSNENIVNMSRQSQHNEKILFIPEESIKSRINTPENIIKNQFIMNEKKNLAKNNDSPVNKPYSEEQKFVPENPNLAHKSIPTPQSHKIVEDLQTDFPKIKSKADLKKEKEIAQSNQIRVDNRKPAIFDENHMHIKQGILTSNHKMALENLNFCPINNYDKNPMNGDKEKNYQPTKKILSKRHQEFKEEVKFEIPSQPAEGLLQIKVSDIKPRDNYFIGKQNMIKKILGSTGENQLIAGDSNNKKINNLIKKNSPNEIEFANGKIISNNKIEVPTVDYIQTNKKMIKMPIEKLAIKKDLNHMNVQNTYQLNANTVLADEFHMPMDKIVNFQHKQTQVLDYNDQSRNNIYLSNIHPDASTIAGGFGDMESDKIILDEINKLDHINSNNLSYSLLDAEEDWNSKNPKDKDDLRFDI